MPTDLDDPLDRTLRAGRRLPAEADPRPGPTPDHRRRGDLARRRSDFARLPKERRFLRFVKRRLGHLFPYIPGHRATTSAYGRWRPRSPAGRPSSRISPSFCDNLRLLDSTPVPCGQSRETVKRSEFAGTPPTATAPPLPLLLGLPALPLCAPDGMPIAFELAPANVGEREVAAELLEGVDLRLHRDRRQGFAGDEFEQFVAAWRRSSCAPTAGRAGRSAPSAASANGSSRSSTPLKDQLSLERHGARTIRWSGARVALRLLALAAWVWHNRLIDQPGRHLAPYTH